MILIFFFVHFLFLVLCTFDLNNFCKLRYICNDFEIFQTYLWSLKWSFLLKRLSQMSHLNGRSSLWILFLRFATDINFCLWYWTVMWIKVNGPKDFIKTVIRDERGRDESGRSQHLSTICFLSAGPSKLIVRFWLRRYIFIRLDRSV